MCRCINKACCFNISIAALAEFKLRTRHKDSSIGACFLGDRQIRAAEKQKHPPAFVIKILKCAHVTLHHQNITAPCHDISITDWRARPPTLKWFPPSLLNHPFVQQALISIFKCSSLGRWSTERDAGCEAISREQRAGGLVGAFMRYRGVGSLTCLCWERGR